MSIRVRLEHGQGAGATWRLGPPGVYTLGRVPQSSIQVLDMRVSKEHAEIHLGENGSAALKDLGSTHGCQVNGQPVNGQVQLKAGDELRMGLSILRVLSDGQADKDATPAEGRTANTGSVPNPAAVETHRTLPPDALVGKELGGYRVERKVGAGGMGGVYVAEQLSLHRKVALKVLSEKFAADRDFVDQFVNEARAAGALNHPNVVQVYDVGQADGQYFFSMEVMPGGSIEDKVKTGPAEWGDALNWFLDSANALIFARKKGILHRDVKPDNLMLAEDGSAKLCDLGLAKKSEHGDLMNQGIIGTPHFISPEAIRRRPDIDHRTDLYSLGCTFYRILTGKNPYPGTTVKEILLGHLNKPVPRVSATNPDVPKDLDDIVYNLMQKEADKRFATPEDLLQALDRVRLQHGLEAHGIKPGGKKPLIIAAIAALAAIGIGIFAFTREDKVVVKPKTAEQMAQERQAAISLVKGELTTATGQATIQANEISKPLVNVDFPLRTSADNWKDARWPQLVTDLRKAADGWDAEAETYRAEAGKAELDEIRQLYEGAAESLAKTAREARAQASDVESYINRRREKASEIQQQREQAHEDLAAVLDAHKKKVEAAIDAGDPVALALLLRVPVIQGLATDIAARKYDDEFELVSAKDVEDATAERFGKRLPQAAYYRTDLLDEASAALQARFEELDKAVHAKTGESATPADLTEALQLVRSFLGSLPEVAEDAREGAGKIATEIEAQRAEAERRKRALEERRKKLVDALYGADSKAYWTLLNALFRPSSARGLFATFDTASAKVAATNFVRDAKTAEYRELGQWWVTAADGVSAALDRLVAAFPAEWSSDKVPAVDDRGRLDHVKVKSIDRSSIERDKERITFEALGPRYVVEFLFRDGGQPRVALTGDQHLGLAVLAEVAGDYDLALSAYRAWQAAGVGDEAATAGVERRLQALELERRASSRWLHALRRMDELKKQLDALDPTLIGMDAFTREKREEAAAKQQEWQKALQEVGNVLMGLTDDKELTATAWMAGLSSAPPADVAYAGEGDGQDGR
ncbi:MAG: protein kinase [Planctomycetota bacterium]